MLLSLNPCGFCDLIQHCFLALVSLLQGSWRGIMGEERLPQSLNIFLLHKSSPKQSWPCPQRREGEIQKIKVTEAGALSLGPLHWADVAVPHPFYTIILWQSEDPPHTYSPRNVPGRNEVLGITLGFRGCPWLPRYWWPMSQAYKSASQALLALLTLAKTKTRLCLLADVGLRHPHSTLPPNKTGAKCILYRGAVNTQIIF